MLARHRWTDTSRQLNNTVVVVVVMVASLSYWIIIRVHSDSSISKVC